MSNNGTHQEKLIRLEEERRFLLLGLNYAEVASKTGLKIRTISEHNRLIHKVDMKKAFALRIQREGTPNHLPKNDVINSWITGLMDAEGCFIFDLSPLSKDGYINYHKPEIGKNAQIGWQCRRLKDLAEVIIPVFEKIPLRTKKGKEFLMWKDLILQRYVDTCGGRFRSGGTRQSYHLLFDETEQSLRKMRGYVYKE